MPRLSDAMEEGTILTWLHQAGEHVDEGAELAEIETDKATVTYESPVAGTLEIVAAAGTTVAVGAVMARVGAAARRDRPAVGLDSSAASADGAAAGPDSSAAPADGAAAGPDRSAAPAEGAAADRQPAPVIAGAPAATSGPVTSNGAVADGAPPVRATPLARRLADRHEVDLGEVRGSGPRGRISKHDVARFAGIPLAPPGTGEGPASPATSPAAPPEPPERSAPASGGESAKGRVTKVEPTRLQQVVARRMSEAKATVPEFQVEAEVAIDPAIDFRAQLKQHVGGEAPSLNDIVVKACALALRAHPRANGAYRDGAFELYGRVNIGVAVAAQDALVVPTVTDADSRSLGSIASETRRLAARVRSGEISPGELSGATFTVSNLGMYGMSAITPVINPPQAAILGVGAARPVPAVIDGELVSRQLMTLRLTCDHRILYGAEAAQFLDAIRGFLERPLALVL